MRQASCNHLTACQGPWAYGDLFTPVHDRPFAYVVYALVFWTALIIGIIPFLGNAYFRILLVTLIVVAYGADQMFQDITGGGHLDLSMLKIVWLERSGPMISKSLIWARPDQPQTSNRTSHLEVCAARPIMMPPKWAFCFAIYVILRTMANAISPKASIARNCVGR
jgi:hypothetical protein